MTSTTGAGGDTAAGSVAENRAHGSAASRWFDRCFADFADDSEKRGSPGSDSLSRVKKPGGRRTGPLGPPDFACATVWGRVETQRTCARPRKAAPRRPTGTRGGRPTSGALRRGTPRGGSRRTRGLRTRGARGCCLTLRTGPESRGTCNEDNIIVSGLWHARARGERTSAS